VGVMSVGLKGGATDAGAGLVTVSGTVTVGQKLDNASGFVGTGIVNVANSGALTADRIFLGNVPATQTGTGTAAGILNIGSGTAGGTVTTGRVQAGGDVAQSTTTTRIVNFNGGLLKVKGGTTFASTFMTGLTSANVYAG